MRPQAASDLLYPPYARHPGEAVQVSALGAFFLDFQPAETARFWKKQHADVAGNSSDACLALNCAVRHSVFPNHELAAPLRWEDAANFEATRFQSGLHLHRILIGWIIGGHQSARGRTRSRLPIHPGRIPTQDQSNREVWKDLSHRTLRGSQNTGSDLSTLMLPDSPQVVRLLESS